MILHLKALIYVFLLPRLMPSNARTIAAGITAPVMQESINESENVETISVMAAPAAASNNRKDP